MAPKAFIDSTLRNAKGNITPQMRNELADWFSKQDEMNYFVHTILGKLEATELMILDVPEEPKKKQVRAVFEVDVTLDMCNAYKSLHGGCSATLIDLCTSIALTLLARHVSPQNSGHVSLALNTTYHAPATLGSRIKIINTTVAMGGRTMSAKAEIYDIANGRLVASGTHLKMVPSAPKPKL